MLSKSIQSCAQKHFQAEQDNCQRNMQNPASNKGLSFHIQTHFVNAVYVPAPSIPARHVILFGGVVNAMCHWQSSMNGCKCTLLSTTVQLWQYRRENCSSAPRLPLQLMGEHFELTAICDIYVPQVDECVHSAHIMCVTECLLS